MTKHCEYCRHLQFKNGGYCYLFETEPDVDFCRENTALGEMFACSPRLGLIPVGSTTIEFKSPFPF